MSITKNAAKLVEDAIIITQANYTPLFRPEILRTHSSLLQLSTMFLSEPLQVFSQLFGSVDRMKSAKHYLETAKTAEEESEAEALMKESKEGLGHAIVTITVDMIILSLIASGANWIKGRDDEEGFLLGIR